MSPIRTNCWIKLHSFSLNREMFSVLTTENERNFSKSWTLCVCSSVVWFSNRITLHYSQFSHTLSPQGREQLNLCAESNLYEGEPGSDPSGRDHTPQPRGVLERSVRLLPRPQIQEEHCGFCPGCWTPALHPLWDVLKAFDRIRISCLLLADDVVLFSSGGSSASPSEVWGSVGMRISTS